MKAKILKIISNLHNRRKAVAALAVAVVLCTVYLLMNPAATLERKDSTQETLEVQSLSTSSADEPQARLVTGKTVTYQVLFDGNWITLGTSSYSTGTVNGSTCAYISSEVAEDYFAPYGYKPESKFNQNIQYSYNDIYTIYYYGSDTYVMDVADNNVADDTKIWLYEYNGTYAQKFRIWEAGSGYSFITPLKNSGYYVNIKGGGTTDGTKLFLRHESDNASRWKVQTDSSGRTVFINANGSTTYIDLPSGTLESKNQLQIWNGGSNRYWSLNQIYEWSTATAEANGSGYNIGLTAESNGNIICRYTPTLSDGDDIYHIADFVKLKNDGTHRLMNDITIDEFPYNSFLTLTDVKTTFDLNGHKVSYNPDTTDSNHTFLTLGDNANLTVADSTGKAKQSSEQVQTENVYGNQATWDKNNKYLTYYVTESTLNSDGITRTDTLIKHTDDITNVGAIESTGPDYPTQLIEIKSNSSTLNVSGGRFTNLGGQHAVYTSATDSTLNVTGGYFCGTKSTAKGGAIYASGNTTLSGGVIAANGAGQGGGIFYHGRNGSTGYFNMTGGIITGNYINVASTQTSGDGMGAGLCVWMENDSSTATLSGGYITNNVADYYCGRVGSGCHHGAGVYHTGGNLTLINEDNSEGVFITGNYHKESGGGVAFNGQQFTMEGGVVSANVAKMGEGGGFRFAGTNKTAYICGGYITNNSTLTTHDWGGGGIFVVSGKSLQIRNSLISENHARGFGGGVTGCPTGQLIVNEGEKTTTVIPGIAALYNNTADGEVMAGSDGVASSKPQDQKAKSNKVFMSNGYQDYFCALNSILTGTMLGGGSENYTGSCDYKPVTLGVGETIVATSMMGMTANPTQEDIQLGKNNAQVYITGNYSGTHGGGVLSNGLLILGEASDVSLKPGLQISVPKIYQKRTDSSTITPEADQFNFLLLDDKVTINGSTVSYTEDNIVERLTNNANGYVSFEPYFPEQTGSTVVTYYLMEEPGNTQGVTYDSKVYKIEIGVGTTQNQIVLSNARKITITYYLVNRVKISVVGDANETKVDGYYWDLNDSSFSGNSTSVGAPSTGERLELTLNNAGFTNTVEDTPVYLKIVKSDGNTEKPMPFVSFTLMQIDETEIETRSTAGDTSTVTFQLEKGKNFLIKETPPDGYHEYGPWLVSVDLDGKVTIYEGKDMTGTQIEGITYSKTNAAISNTWNLENYSGHILPETGGVGTKIFTVCGSLTVAAAAMGIIISHKRKKLK